MERIFHRGWVFVGHESEIPGPGDFVTRTLGTQPVLMVRGSEGGVSVFLNRCAHRGTMVCPASQGNARTFACPYHGWTYGLGGELLGVPYPGGYASDRSVLRSLARGRDRAQRGMGQAPVRRELEDAARERQRRVPPGIRAPRALQDDPHPVPSGGR